LVDAINEIFRVENAPYHLTSVVTREERDTGPNRRSTTGFEQVQILARKGVMLLQVILTESKGAEDRVKAIARKAIRKVFDDTPKGLPATAVLRTTLTFEPQANPALDDTTFRFMVPSVQK
jgi:hypothetical protein